MLGKPNHEVSCFWQLVLPADWLPLQHPAVADHLHFLYNVTAPLILLKVTVTRLRLSHMTNSFGVDFLSFN